MTEYPQTLAALREQENKSWAVADALLAEIATHPDGGRVVNGEYDRCAAWLAERGYEATPAYLADMRRVAVKFPVSETRKWQVAFRLYMEAIKQPAKWTPELMDAAEREGLTLRQFSERLTGTPWADDDSEAIKRALADPATAAAIAKHALADPAIADEIMRDQPTRHSITVAQDKHYASTHPRGGADDGAPDKRLKMTPLVDSLDLMSIVVKVKRAEAQMLELVAKPHVRGNAAHRNLIVSHAEWLANASEILLSAVNGASIDDALAEILADGE